MSDFSQSLIDRPVGRPPLKGELTSVRLDPGDKERITALRGTYGLAKFVREAVKEKLEREPESPRRERTKPKTPDGSEG